MLGAAGWLVLGVSAAEPLVPQEAATRVSVSAPRTAAGRRTPVVGRAGWNMVILRS